MVATNAMTGTSLGLCLAALLERGAAAVHVVLKGLHVLARSIEHARDEMRCSRAEYVRAPDFDQIL